MFAEDETISIVARDKVVEKGTLTVHQQCTVKCGGKEFIGEVCCVVSPIKNKHERRLFHPIAKECECTF